MTRRFLVFLLLPLFAFVTIDWVTIDLDNRFSINFPSKPDQKDLGGNPMWVQEIGTNARCMAIVIDFSNYGLDSAGLAAEMGRDEAMDQFKTGILGQIPGATVTAERITTTQGKKTFELEIDMGNKDTTQLNKMHSKSIIAGTKMYTVSFYEKKNLPQTEMKEKFFNSIKVR